MEIKYTIDLGQLFLIGVVTTLGIIGYFIKKEIAQFGTRIDKHDDILFRLTGQVQRLIGYYEAARYLDNEQGR